MHELARPLAGLLLELSYMEGDFTLTSGRKSSYYFDGKQTALHPEGAWLVGNIFFDMLAATGVRGVGGMTLGADPLVSSVVVVSRIRESPMPGFIIRKKAKGHGSNQYVEGMKNFAPGDRVALLEDVVTTGGTLLASIERVEQAGLQVADVLCMLDREEGGSQKLSEAGYPLRAIFTRSSLLHAGGR
ncbi:MAG: orotate phosphoribosyltransferase [Desulfovibrionaceae bacterium]